MSRRIPVSDNLVLVRTSFLNEERWESLVRDAKIPQSPSFPTSTSWTALSMAEKRQKKLAAFPADYLHSAVFLADERAISEAGHPCLIVGIAGQERSSFRALARELASIDSNLSIGNMDFEELEGAVSPDGVFKGARMRNPPNQALI